MAPINLKSLEAQIPHIKLHHPDSPEFTTLTNTFVVSAAKPLAIARPQSIEDVQTLVRFCVSNGIEFSVRTGGHNCVGRTLVDEALLIDMRDIKSVSISEDSKTATVGGGVLAGGLLEALGEHGLVTPCGSTGTVGYVGWSTGGGYGLFLNLFGLGADQIVGAKLVDAKGDIVDVKDGDELIKGIRGAGAIFGVVVELTIKVYPLKQILAATVIFESSDMQSTWSKLINGLGAMTLPPPLNVHIFGGEFPGLGKALAAIITWADDDHEEGRKMIDQVVSLGTCIVNTTEAKTVAQYAKDNEKLVMHGLHGRSYTVNIKEWTPTALNLVAKYNSTVPAGGAMITIHSLRSSRPNKESVFKERESHHVVEIVSMTADPTLKENSSAWGMALLKELKEQDRGNVLDSAYIAFLDYEDADLEKIYGQENLDTLISLKKKYDPGNVFKHAMPKIIV